MLNARSYFPVVSGSTIDLTGLGVTIPGDVSQNYTISVTSDNAGTPPGFQVQAAPKALQAAQDAKCGTLVLTSVGGKTASGGGSRCW